MKPILLKALCVFLALFVFAVMAWGSSSDSESKPISGSSTSSSSDAGSDSSQTDSSPKDVSIDEQVLLDRDGVVVTAKSYSKDSIWGDGIKLLVENNTSQNLTVSCRDLIVNHYMVSELFSCSVAAGKKNNETLTLSSSDLKEAGIQTVAEVEVSFHVYDSDSWDTYFDSDSITIKTSEYGNVEYIPNDSGVELFNNGQIRIVGKYVNEDTFWGTGILLYMENNSSQKITVQTRNFSVNGFMMTPLFSKTVCSGRMAMGEITLLSNEMEENGIETVEEVELSFHIYDDKTYNTVVDTDPITFTVNP